MTLSRNADIEKKFYAKSFFLNWSIPIQSFNIMRINSIFRFRQDFLFQQDNGEKEKTCQLVFKFYLTGLLHTKRILGL